MGQELRFVFIATFMIITVITAIVVLLANIGTFGTDVMQGELAKWGIGAVLGEIVIATVAAFKWEVLSSKNMLIIFDLKSPLISGAKLDSCSYEITDEKNNVIDKGEVRIARDSLSGYWKCFIPLPSNMKYEHTTTIKIKDNNGKEYDKVSDWILQHTLEV